MTKPIEIVVSALVGALFGLILGPLLRALYYKLFHRPKPKHLIRDWIEYHWTYQHDEPVLYQATWKIRRGLAHPFSLKLILSDGMIYKGHIVPEEHHLCVTVHSQDHTETGTFRFPNRLPSDRSPLVGFWLSYDHDKIVATGASILVPDEIPAEQVKELLRETIRDEDQMALMRETTRRQQNKSVQATK